MVPGEVYFSKLGLDIVQDIINHISNNHNHIIIINNDMWLDFLI